MSGRAMTMACVLVAAVGCSPRVQPRTPEATALEVLDVRPVPRADDRVELSSWTRPAAGSRWSLVDRSGTLGEVTIEQVTESAGCDHCPPFKSQARAMQRIHVPIGDAVFAVGPLSSPLPHARVLAHDDNWPESWSRTQKDNHWILETAIDLDSDGKPDLARYATGAAVRFEVRTRIGHRWKTTSSWSEPYVLDVDDVSAPGSR